MKKTVFNNVSVTVANKGTNNHCVNVGQFVNGKDFMFDIDGQKYRMTATQVMAYIASHPDCYRKKKYSKIVDDREKISYSSYYLISDNYIINNAIIAA